MSKKKKKIVNRKQKFVITIIIILLLLLLSLFKWKRTNYESQEKINQKVYDINKYTETLSKRNKMFVKMVDRKNLAYSNSLEDYFKLSNNNKNLLEIIDSSTKKYISENRKKFSKYELSLLSSSLDIFYKKYTDWLIDYKNKSKYSKMISSIYSFINKTEVVKIKEKFDKLLIDNNDTLNLLLKAITIDSKTIHSEKKWLNTFELISTDNDPKGYTVPKIKFDDNNSVKYKLFNIPIQNIEKLLNKITVI